MEKQNKPDHLSSKQPSSAGHRYITSPKWLTARSYRIRSPLFLRHTAFFAPGDISRSSVQQAKWNDPQGWIPAKPSPTSADLIDVVNLEIFFGQLIDPKHTWFACLLLSSGTGLSRGNGGVGLSNAFFVWSYRFPNISVTCRCCTRTRIHLPLNARSRLCVV